MNLYTLKNGDQVSLIPKGKCRFIEGETNKSGYLTLIGRVASKKGCPKVLCRCKCGNYTVLTHQAFKNETTKSCGCYGQLIFKKNGQRVGKLPNKGKDYSQNQDNPFYLYLEQTNKKSGRSFLWNIKCRKCGKIYQEIPSMLISNTRRKGNNPCECWKKTSKGVLKIEEILINNGISFVREYSFDNCLSPLGNLMKFDFYIENKYLIEYDGEQHFIPTSFYSIDQNIKEKRFKKQQEYDQIKTNYCLKNDIPLIRIPYTKYESLSLEDLILKTSKYQIKKIGEIEK